MRHLLCLPYLRDITCRKTRKFSFYFLFKQQNVLCPSWLHVMESDSGVCYMGHNNKGQIPLRLHWVFTCSVSFSLGDWKHDIQDRDRICSLGFVLMFWTTKTQVLTRPWSLAVGSVSSAMTPRSWIKGLDSKILVQVQKYLIPCMPCL